MKSTEATEPARRVALVGAAGLLGREIKEQLALAGIPGGDVALFDLQEEIGLLTDYGDEARVVLDATLENLRSYGLVVFCDATGLGRRLAPAVVEAGGTVVDCTGELHADALWGGDAASLEWTAGVLGVPHPGTVLLSTLARWVSLEGAVVTLMLPASATADTGAERLARQSLQLLSLEQADDEGRRAAFDQWPDPPAGNRIADEMARLGKKAPHLMALRSPVFHGVAAATWLPRTDAAAVRDALHRAGIPVADGSDEAGVDSPARVAGRSGLHVANVHDRGDGGTWIWALVDNHLAAAAVVVEIVSIYRTVDGETHN